MRAGVGKHKYHFIIFLHPNQQPIAKFAKNFLTVIRCFLTLFSIFAFVYYCVLTLSILV
jgi:hypothetical protein